MPLTLLLGTFIINNNIILQGLVKLVKLVKPLIVHRGSFVAAKWLIIAQFLRDQLDRELAEYITGDGSRVMHRRSSPLSSIEMSCLSDDYDI
jgi:hypothetical protein